jgi:hypothetical protein
MAPRRLCALDESRAEFVAPATDCFVRDHDTTLEQQLLNIAQARVSRKYQRTAQLMTTAGKR